MTFAFVSGLIPVALLLVVTAIFIRAGLYRRFRFFFVCAVYSIVETTVRLSVMQRPVTFFVVYWTTETVYGMLALLAVFEVFMPTAELYLGRVWSRLAPAMAFLGIVGVSLWRGLYHPVGHGGSLVGLAAGAYAFMLGVLCVEALVFFVCIRLAFRKPYPIRWGRYRLGILSGFGLQAFASAAVLAARINFGPRFDSFFHYVLPGAYIGATVIWLVAFAGEDTLPVAKKIDLDTIRRAVEYVDRESDKAEEDLGMKRGALSRPEPVHSLIPRASPAKQ